MKDSLPCKPHIWKSSSGSLISQMDVWANRLVCANGFRTCDTLDLKTKQNKKKTQELLARKIPKVTQIFRENDQN
jgi:hypothetical protein